MKDSILNITVSGFRDYNTPSNPQPVNLLRWLTSNKYAEKVAAIRVEQDKAVKDSLKSTLPAITPSGEFSYRSARCLTGYSKLMQFDIDFKENSHITNYSDLKKQLCKIVNVAYCGLSVSGTGFWGLLPIVYPEKHQQHFEFVYTIFKDIGVTIDKKPRNVASLRGYSYDPDAYFNHNAKPLEHYHRPAVKSTKSTLYTDCSHSTPNNVERLINELIKKGIDLTNTYDDWLSIGFAFTHEFGEIGRGYFHDISSLYPGYDNVETDDQYNKCLKAGATSTPITIKTFFHRCKDSGVTLSQSVKQVQAGTECFKIKTMVQPIHLYSNTIINFLRSCHTGIEYDNISMQSIETDDGEVYDILLNAEGELIRPGEHTEVVNNLAVFYERKFEVASLDGLPCLIERQSTKIDV